MEKLCVVEPHSRYIDHVLSSLHWNLIIFAKIKVRYKDPSFCASALPHPSLLQPCEAPLHAHSHTMSAEGVVPRRHFKAQHAQRPHWLPRVVQDNSSELICLVLCTVGIEDLRREVRRVPARRACSVIDG